MSAQVRPPHNLPNLRHWLPQPSTTGMAVSKPHIAKYHNNTMTDEVLQFRRTLFSTSSLVYLLLNLSVTATCMLTCLHEGLQCYQLRFVKHVSFAELLSLDLQAAAVPSSIGLLPVCSGYHPGWQRQLGHTLDSHMHCQGQHTPCAPSPAN